MPLTLRRITMENFHECLALSVKEDQRRFVASNVHSLAEAKVDDVSIPCAIYADEQMVGFIMYDFEPQESRGYITRLMIDARFQGKGYGRQAMEQVMTRLRSIPDCRDIQTSFVPDNASAAGLYATLGFEGTGEIDAGEIVVRYVCPTA
jgi:diamine N-acetyltransferase